MKRDRIASDARRATALTYFATLVEREGGYLLRGVHGWAHPEDVRRTNAGIVWEECCAQLAESGLLVRELASVPQATSPEYVYRVTDAGIARYNVFSRRNVPAIPPLGPPDPVPRFYAPEGGLWILRTLSDGLAAGTNARRLNGEPGWLTAAEITQQQREWNDRFGRPGTFRCYSNPAMLELIALGLVAKGHVRLDGRRTPAIVYRVTCAGRTVELLEWNPPADEPESGCPRMHWLASSGRTLASGG